MSLQLKNLLFSIIFALLGAPLALASKGWSPLLPLEVRPVQLPSVNAALRDPTIDLDSMNAARMKQLDRKNSALSKSLKSTQKKKRSGLYSQLVENLLSQIYFLDYVGSAQDWGITGGYGPADLRKKRSQLVRILRQWDALRPATRTRAKIRYHIATQQFAASKDPSGGLQALRKIAKSRHLNSTLKNKVRFVDSYVRLMYGNPKSKGVVRARSYLIDRLPGMDRNLQILGEMALAKSFSGVSHNGERLAAPDSNYRYHLARSVRLSKGYSTVYEDRILTYGIWLWKATERSSLNPPFDLQRELNANRPVAFAVLERVALEKWKKGQGTSTIKSYRFIATKSNNAVRRAKIDRRIIQLHQSLAKQSGRIAALEKELIIQTRAYKRFSKSRVQVLHAAYIQSTYSKLVMQQSKRAERMNQTGRTAVIQSLSRYIKHYPTAKDRTRAHLRIARLHALSKDYGKAVAAYISVAKSTRGKQSVAALKKAIKYQHALTGWPTKPPLDRPSNSSSGPNKMLLAKLYGELTTVDGFHWDYASQEALLRLSAQKKQAEAIFMRALQRQPDHPYAAPALGILAKSARDQKDWQQLESLARFGLEKEITPTYNKKRISAKSLLGLSLFEGGKRALATKKYSLASQKLLEFVKNFADKRRPQAMFLLAHSYQGDRKTTQAISVLQDMARTYADHPIFKRTVLTGGNWAEQAGFEESIMFFHHEFLKKWPNDPNSIDVRNRLIHIFLARELYAEAIHTLGDQAKADTSNQTQHLLEAIRLEKNYGSIDQSYRRCRSAIEQSASSRIEALCLQIQIEKTLEEESVSPTILKKLAVKARSLSGKNPELQESRAQIYLTLAEAASERVMEEVFTLEMTDPIKDLKKRYRMFQRLQAGYTEICTFGENGICAEAMYQLARLAENFVTIVEDFEMPETLASSSTKEFSTLKRSIIHHTKQLAKKSDARAVRVVERGNSLPEITRQVLWHNGNDWNFHPISAEPGSGYVQW